MKLKPETGFQNYYEAARFDLNWNINLFLTLILPFLALALYVFSQQAYITTLIGWSTCLTLLIVMRVTKKFYVASIFFTLIGVSLCSSTMIFFQTSFHLVDTLWMIISILYAYFTLGKTWGNIALAANTAALVYFILFRLNDNLFSVKLLNQGEIISLCVNSCICSIIIAYLIYQFLNTNRFAESNYLRMTSELQQKNKEVELQHEEKTVMLREIHHRVKNNLQVITSLLRLQSREARDLETIELFKDSTNRVVAMALIHEKMYQTKDLAKINLEDYLRTLLNDLIESYSIEIPIKADIVSRVEMISNKSLVPLALLFNELTSNSLKHAFARLSEGYIKISIERQNAKIILHYQDNGTWREKQKGTSFGLELIESLTEQLDGTCTRSVTQGTSYEFILPDNL
ncbi:MAG: sensor histidine kinase [Bacteroidetes bacterium]|nr:sensor histidine kinase [Bacteroidota bacterium]